MTSASIQAKKDNSVLYCKGTWTLANTPSLENQFQNLRKKTITAEKITIRGEDLSDFDSSGALLLQQFFQQLQKQGKTIQLKGFSDAQLSLIDLIKTEKTALKEKKIPKKNALQVVGEDAYRIYDEIFNCLCFIGEFTSDFLQSCRHPKRFRGMAFLATIHKVGCNALGIVALLSALIGVVLVYQMGLQLKLYGANIFIVNLSGMAILREFAPLITAILLAGRTSSSFTAEIGSMKIHEEIDALKTMGLSPMDFLVIPKVLGLLVALPLLTMWADIFGMIGCMIMANGSLNISYYEFATRFQEVTELKTFLVGMVKTPLFALIIAVIGCHQGFRVSFSADSVGKRTTISVVHAIFLIIVADALFSIVFSWLGI